VSEASSPTPSRRDRDLRRLRGAAWTLAAGATVVTGALSVAAAHAFKGHDGTKRASAVARPATHDARVRVPPPQHVPAIVGDPTPLQAPAQPPAAAPQPPAPAPQPQPQTSGGS
jgi:hypothetical protein